MSNFFVFILSIYIRVVYGMKARRLLYRMVYKSVIEICTFMLFFGQYTLKKKVFYGTKKGSFLGYKLGTFFWFRRKKVLYETFFEQVK